MDDESGAELVRVADRMADAARRVVRPYFRAGVAIEDKGSSSFDPVTQADRAVERAMRQVLAEERPQDGILGEEEAPVAGTTGLTWVIDPIDGTRAFISGMPTWGVLIALTDVSGPVLGVIDQPFMEERFHGRAGHASYTRGAEEPRPMVTRQTTDLADAVLFTTFPEIGTAEERVAFEAVRDRVRMVRYGTDCYGYALLALGQIDLVIEAGLMPYDIQAPIAVVEAAGGVVTDWSGGPAHQGGRALAAATPALHAAALEILTARI
ncbi:MAG: histidinol-phosphatase [Pseudomonadota bacterium]